MSMASEAEYFDEQETRYSTAPLHAVKGVQVESNGPLRPVFCQSHVESEYRGVLPNAAQIAAEKPRSKKSKQPLQLHSPRSNSISNTPATAETACSARDFAC